MIIGVTGGIGCGKSTVSRALSEKLSYVHISTDDLAKRLMAEDENLKKALKNAFSDEIFTEDGLIDKKKYAALIYGDPRNLALNDSIVHPAVWNEVKKEVQGNAGGYIVETALPGEAFRDLCDLIIYVKTDNVIRIARLMENRGYTLEYAAGIIENQKPESLFEAISDITADNSGTIEETLLQIKEKLCFLFH